MNATRRIALARYVLSTLARLKGRYLLELENAFGPSLIPPYFTDRRVRARVLGYLMGLEAWHQVLFGEVRGQAAGRWLVSSAAAAYDDAVDLEGFREWRALERFLMDGGEACARFGSGPAAGALAPCLARMSVRSSVRWDSLRGHLLAINNATWEGFEAATRSRPDPGALRRATYDKGGRSFQLLAALDGEALPASVLETAYGFGAACQLADDIYDVAEDVRIGQHTLASSRLLDTEDRRLIEGATDRLPRHAAGVPALLVAAWRTHLCSALRTYDADSRQNTWRHDFGQAAFRFGIRVIPGRH